MIICNKPPQPKRIDQEIFEKSGRIYSGKYTQDDSKFLALFACVGDGFKLISLDNGNRISDDLICTNREFHSLMLKYRLTNVTDKYCLKEIEND